MSAPLTREALRFRCILPHFCYYIRSRTTCKRPISLAVEIPQPTSAGSAGMHTPSPLESLQLFSKLSLGSSPALPQCTEGPHGGICPAPCASDAGCFVSIGPYQTETCSKGMCWTDLVICTRILTRNLALVLLFFGRFPYGRR
jgi:hypothetical protein